MRRIALALLALALLVPGSGCLAVSSHVRGVCRKSVVVYEGQMYVVDVNRCVAHRVAITKCDPSDRTEVVIIEADD